MFLLAAAIVSAHALRMDNVVSLHLVAYSSRLSLAMHDLFLTPPPVLLTDLFGDWCDSRKPKGS